MSVLRASIGAPTLRSAVSALLAAHPGRSGVRLVPDGREAFAQRVRGARLAQRSLDVQTYIWRDDSTGRFLAHELLCAAERGIHVRVLLDDMDARPRQVALEALDRHPKIEVRLFNPFRTRSGWLRTLAEILQRGKRLNHRMHNKTWIADDLVAICGGRNIGNEYFAAADGMNFIDLDVVMLGPAVERAAEEFERYWESDFAVPIDRLRRYSRQILHPQNLEARLQASAREAANADFARALEEDDPVEGLTGQTYVWSADVHVVFDDPRKALGKPTAEPSHVLDSMAHEVRAASREVLLISPYFVPGVGGTAALRSLAHQGAAVEVLTNSLAATDVAIVHSGYAKYRTPLLEVGVRLFELKCALDDDGHSRFRLGSSRASLHTKAAVIDAERVFVGSFNIDPRSAYLNCEMGVWIRSKKLAEQLRSSFRNGTDPRRSFALRLNDDGRIQWTEHGSEGPITHHREPHASWIRRTIVRMLEALPIESQL